MMQHTNFATIGVANLSLHRAPMPAMRGAIPVDTSDRNFEDLTLNTHPRSPTMKPTTLLAAAALCLTTALPAMAACSDRVGQGVDWSGCDKPNQSWSYVSLQHAHLTGINLSGTDLRYTNLTHADLTNANLNRANLRGADLTGAHLGGATWTDGRTCAAGSVGTCD